LLYLSSSKTVAGIPQQFTQILRRPQPSIVLARNIAIATSVKTL
jgi:hypothetical protein